jgi:hypothetical protein
MLAAMLDQEDLGAGWIEDPHLDGQWLFEVAASDCSH